MKGFVCASLIIVITVALSVMAFNSTTAAVDSETFVGAQIGQRVVIFSKSEVAVEQGQFGITGSGLYKTIIADLAPNTNYSVGLDGTLLSGFPKSTTANGLLVFDLSLSGTHSVTVTLGELPSVPATLGKPGKPQHVD